MMSFNIEDQIKRTSQMEILKRSVCSTDTPTFDCPGDGIDQHEVLGSIMQVQLPV